MHSDLVRTGMVVQRLACVQIKLLISRNSRIAGTFLAVLLLFGEVSAQIHTPPRPSPQYMNSVGGSASVGSFYNKGSYFFGAGFDYGRVLKGPWSFGLGVSWDREIEKPFDKPSKQVNSWTFIPTITYLLNSHFSLTTGVGQGFADDDSPERRMRFKKGSLGTGVALGISLPDIPFLERDAIGLSVAWEYSFGEKQPSISIDLAMSFGF